MIIPLSKQKTGSLLEASGQIRLFRAENSTHMQKRMHIAMYMSIIILPLKLKFFIWFIPSLFVYTSAERFCQPIHGKSGETCELSAASDLHDCHRVSVFPDDADQVLRIQPDRGGVVIRMETDELRLIKKCFIQIKMNLSLRIVQ